MELLEKILVATDFSKTSENVINHAITLAKTFKSSISLVHVLPGEIKNEKAKKLLEDAAKNQFDIINKKIISEGISSDKPILKFGNQFDQILDTVQKLDPNMLLIGSGEKSQNDTFLLGTTAEKIIRRCDKPVWVVKKDEPLNVETILCPVDFSPESKRALNNAITMTRRFNAKLIVFSVAEINYTSPMRLKVDWEEEKESAREENNKKFDLFLKDFNLIDLNWVKETKEGDPASEILRATKRHEPDLLIMGTTGKSGLSRIMMGSVTEKVIRELPCTFVTMKTAGIINLRLETRIRDIEGHYATALQLMKDGFYKESINEFRICLNINDMHIPSLNNIALVYEKLGDSDSSKRYKNIVKDLMNRIWDKKIEAELRGTKKH